MFSFRTLLSLLIFFASSFAGAQTRKVASTHTEQRWTLSDWLAQRDRSRMMDLWLSFNSPSPYELMVGGQFISYTNKTETPLSERNYSSLAGEFSAYAQIFGITAEYENNTKENFNDVTGIFNLRILGNSLQNSSLTLNYGLRTRDMGANDLNTTGHEIALRQQFGQASLQLYLHKYFGIDGFYRQYLPTNDDDLGKVQGHSTEAGAFIDFGQIRVFGRWYEEQNTLTSVSTSTDNHIIRTGVKTGLKFFF